MNKWRISAEMKDNQGVWPQSISVAEQQPRLSSSQFSMGNLLVTFFKIYFFLLHRNSTGYCVFFVKEYYMLETQQKLTCISSWASKTRRGNLRVQAKQGKREGERLSKIRERNKSRILGAEREADLTLRWFGSNLDWHGYLIFIALLNVTNFPWFM